MTEIVKPPMKTLAAVQNEAVSAATRVAEAAGAELRPSVLMLDRVPCVDPRVDPAIQGADALIADLPQHLRNLDRGGLVGTRAIDDDLAVDGNALEAFRDLLHVDRPRARDASGRCLHQRRTHIDDRVDFPFVHERAQLINRYAVHTQ